MDPPFKNFSGQLDSLAFLSLNDVQLGMNTIRNIALISNETIDVLRLLDYFDKTYVNGLGNGNQPPLLPPLKWNKHLASLNNEPRANNICEGQKNRLRTLCNNNRPHMEINQCVEK